MNAFKIVFKNYKYILLALGVMFLVFTLSIWLPNWRLVVEVVSSSQIPLLNKLSILTGLLGSIKTNFTLVSAGYTIAIAVLFGIEISLLTYYIKSRRNLFIKGGVATGFGGLVSGVFGIGCASCGTFLLTSIFVLFGAGWIITLLPLRGEEFGILGVLLLMYSIYIISRKMQKPIVCKV